LFPITEGGGLLKPVSTFIFNLSEKMKSDFNVIAFDADDTLWVNEPYYRETEDLFYNLLSDYMPAEKTGRELFQTEMDNLKMYGYGTKGFMLSMIETALRISENKVPAHTIQQIIELGKEQLRKPVILLEGVVDILEYLRKKQYKLVVATKGDLVDQERKLKASEIIHYFHHVEIMSNKKENDYKKLIQHLDISPEYFLMVGNSYKSDIEPVINLNGFGVHIPFHITWEHEKSVEMNEHPNWIKINHISEIKNFI
jgi:putative hydrolase of the HAD superfamily